MMAALGNRLFAYHQEVMEGRWGGHFHPGLWRTTVGIIGLGRIGRALARRCRGFEMRTPRLRRRRRCGLCREPTASSWSRSSTLFREADFVSVHAPHTPATDKIVNREHLALMKPSAFLINTARGGLVDEAALYEALAQAGSPAPGWTCSRSSRCPPARRCASSPNVVLTPHCAGGSVEAVVAMTKRCVDNILAIRDRSPLGEDLLNPEALAG